MSDVTPAPATDPEAVRQQYRYELLTWPEINEAVRQEKVIVLPVGSVEQHGWHLPLDVDFRLASSVCLGAGARAPAEMLVMPPVNYGYCHHVMDFPGTINIEPSDLCPLPARHHALRRLSRLQADHPRQWAWLESSTGRAGRAANESPDGRRLLHALLVATDRGEVEHGDPYFRHAGGMRARLRIGNLDVHASERRRGPHRPHQGRAAGLYDEGAGWREMAVGRPDARAAARSTLSAGPRSTRKPDRSVNRRRRPRRRAAASSTHATEQLVELVRWFKARPAMPRREHHATPPTFALPFDF